MLTALGLSILGYLPADLITVHTDLFTHVRLTFSMRMEAEVERQQDALKETGGVPALIALLPTEEENCCYKEWDLLISNLKNLHVHMTRVIKLTQAANFCVYFQVY